MIEEVKHKAKSILLIIIDILGDIVLLLSTLGILEFSKFIMEVILYKRPIEEVDGGTFSILYITSKISIVSLVIIYSIFSIGKVIKQEYKKLSK